MRAFQAAMMAVGLAVAGGRSAGDDALVSDAVRLARDRVFPAVVRIDVHARAYAGGEKEIVRGTGSGVIIDAEGHILTNFHVAGRAERLIVTLVNKERVRARLVGADHWTDLAVIQVDPEEARRKKLSLEPAPLGESASVVIGEPVLAMGTPYGLSRTMTQGIVTNNERYFSGESIDGYETGDFNNWLQTDAAINPGNSGGPLVNMRGEVIGINTRAAPLAEGLGFAVPIDVARAVVREILERGAVHRGYVGVRFRELLDLETHFGLDANQGVLIESVDPGSPADRAGIRAEDILLKIDDAAVSARFPEELPAVRKRIADRAAGATVRLLTKRRGTTHKLEVTTVELESEIAEDEQEFDAWGLTARSITSVYASKERLPDRLGVLVTGVKNASAAERAGLAIGDVIRAVDQRDVRDLSEFDEAYRASVERKETKVLIEVRRGVTVQLLVLKPQEPGP